MVEKDDDKNKEPEITPVGPGADEEEIHSEADEREASRTREDDDDEEDERVGRSEDDEEDGEGEGIDRKREKRRAERKRLRKRAKDDRVELRFLRQRNEELERRFSAVDTRLDQADVGNIDARIASIDGQIAEADRVIAQAIDEKNGKVAIEAQNIRDGLRDEKAQLSFQKGQRIQQSRQRQQQGSQQVDPTIARNVENWMADNDWFDPQLRDEDSRVARAIEDALYLEKGPNAARNPEYWEEYNRRLAKRGIGPNARRNGSSRDRDRDEEEDYDEEDDDDREEEREERPRRKVRGPRITTGGRERPLRKGEVYVSAERRDAMEKAGVWDNPTLRAKYLRQYAKYDQEHRDERRR